MEGKHDFSHFTPLFSVTDHVWHCQNPLFYFLPQVGLELAQIRSLIGWDSRTILVVGPYLVCDGVLSSEVSSRDRLHIPLFVVVP